MPPERAFRVLRAQSDRVSFRQLVSIALACASLGLALGGAADRFLPARRAARGRASVTARQGVGGGQREPALQASLAPTPALAAAAAVAFPLLMPPQETPQHGPPPPAADARASRATRLRARGGLRLERDQVSYLRCAAQPGPKGCARSPALEQSVWRALRSVAACYGRGEPPGSAEMRLDLHRGRAPEIALLPPRHAPSLNLRAVRGCVDSRFAKGFTHESQAPRLVSFRFGLR